MDADARAIHHAHLVESDPDVHPVFHAHGDGDRWHRHSLSYVNLNSLHGPDVHRLTHPERNPDTLANDDEHGYLHELGILHSHTDADPSPHVHTVTNADEHANADGPLDRDVYRVANAITATHLPH